MTTETDFLRMVISHEREFGALTARANAQDQNIARIAERVEAGFAEHKQMLADGIKEMEHTTARESAHIRGEIDRLDKLYREQRKEDDARREAQRQRDDEQDEKRRAEERKRNEDLIAELKGEAASEAQASKDAQRINRRIMLALVVAAVCAQTLLENMPAVLRFVDTILSGVSQ